ncbi:MAG: pallilysin-related adhesin [Spirochaetota bacterium]
MRIASLPIAAVSVLVLALASCGEPAQRSEIEEPGRVVTPRGGNGIVLAAETASERSEENRDSDPELKVRLPPEYIPSQAITANLDLDETDEQIIVFKRRDDPDDLIRLLVVSFDPIRNSWVRAWEGVTAATSVRSFSVYTDDLIGDHEQELVAFGINNDGEQTLDVFRRTNDALGLGLSFAPILSITADVTIEVDEVPRSEAYEAMETVSAPSFPIIAERRDLESENVFDTVQTTYFWDYASRRYVPGRVESISGEAIEDSRLRDLFAGDEEDFEQFLSGPWYRSSGAGEIQMAFFGPRDRTIVFHSGYLQQSFIWDNSTTTVYGRGVSLFVTNESIRTVKKLVNVSVGDLNEITVSMQGSEGLDGTYERLTGSLQAAVLESDERVRLSPIDLSGLYRSDSGVEIFFSDPQFTYREGSDRRLGGYALYELGDDLVLSMKFVDENRLPTDHRDYRAVFDESREGDRIVRRLELAPGEIGIAGFDEMAGTELVLEQIEVLDDEAASGDAAGGGES